MILEKLLDTDINKICIYNRVSTQKQSSFNKHSLKKQRDLCINYANKYYPDIKQTIYEDVGSLYKNRNKMHNFNRMIKNLDTNTLILVSEISRLGRNVDQVFFLLKQVKNNNSYIVSILDNLCYNKEDVMDKDFMHKIIDSEKESDILSKNVKNKIEYIKNNGGYIGKPPYGYKIVKVNNIPKLEENIEEMKTLEYITCLLDDNLNAKEIAEILNKENYMNRNRYWNKSSVKRLIKKYVFMNY